MQWYIYRFISGEIRSKIIGYDVKLCCCDTGIFAATGTNIIAPSVDGIWKKCSIKPAARRKCKIKIPLIKNTDLLEFCRAGLKMIIKTAPVDNAALNTRIHCKNEICITHKTDTGM